MAINIPKYALYGELNEAKWENFFNHEFLPERSSIYNWKIPPHIHESFIQLLFFRQGNADVLLNNIQHKISSPCLLLIPAGTVHSLSYSVNIDGSAITASQIPIELVTSSLVSGLIPIVKTPAVYNIPNDFHETAIAQLYGSIEKELQQNQYGNFAACVLLFVGLLINIARIHSQTITITRPFISSKKAVLIEKFLSLIETKAKPHTSIKEYADEIGVTSGHLSRVCQEVLGGSSLDIINAYIIREVKKELIYTTKSIKQLAYEHGFPEVAYFTRFFKKHTGYSPQQFRNIATNKANLSDNSL